MKGEGVLLGRRHPCARSSSVCALVVRVRTRRPGRGEGWGMMEGELLGCRRPWALVVRGWGVVVGRVR